MIIRKQILPKCLQDAVVTSFVTFIIPTVYWFEMCIVLPSFYEVWSFWYTFHFLTGTFIFLNVTTNFIGIILCDTSINGLMLPAVLKENWRFCAVCESIAPPRSWHCNVCNTCILRRDHHCIFTGCCVGHTNTRYFIVFLLYVFIATLYATSYNVFFIYNTGHSNNWLKIVNFLFPLAMIFIEQTSFQLYMFLTLIIVVACVFTGVLLFYHTDLIIKGIVTFERRFKKRLYDLGTLENVKSVLGERWYLIWTTPYVESKPTHDGIHWETIKTN